MIIPDIQRKTDTSITSILLYWLNLTPTQSIYLLTTYYPQKVLNLLFAQRLDSYLKSSKLQSPSLLDFSSLYSFIFISFFIRFSVSARYTKFLLYLLIVVFYVLYICFCIYCLHRKKVQQIYRRTFMAKCYFNKVKIY